MQLYIDNRSDAPIYDQTYQRIKGAILSGQAAEGETLPSTRAPAKDLRISVITTKRAYDELKNEGLLYTVPGKGCFVAKHSTELLREENLKKIESAMQDIRRLARGCGLTEPGAVGVVVPATGAVTHPWGRRSSPAAHNIRKKRKKGVDIRRSSCYNKRA